MVQAILVVILLRRRLFRIGELPFFFAYTCYSILTTILRHSYSHNPYAFFTVYWSTEVGYAVLALFAVNEVFKRIFELDYEVYPWSRVLLPGLSVAISVIFLWGAMHPAHSGIGRITTAIFSFDLGVHCVEGLLLLLFLALRWYFSAAWSRYDYGILIGFGVSACTTLAADAARSVFGTRSEAYFVYVPPMGYLAAALIWLWTFSAKPQPPEGRPIADLLNLVRRGNVRSRPTSFN